MDLRQMLGQGHREKGLHDVVDLHDGDAVPPRHSPADTGLPHPRSTPDDQQDGLKGTRVGDCGTARQKKGAVLGFLDGL
ncbi:hypothetical protein ACFPC0_00090 [Streptomyces andamanensis]|uniref:Uncharacterized protein n=1 Tax=Streptomyces andamanensis TaxID=1565035 RepID=A0ABV8T681_9ACTN